MKSAKGKLIITEYAGNVLSILLDADGKAQRINVESIQRESILGNIYIGRVTRIMSNLNAAFMEYAGGAPGYLPLDGNKKPVFLNSRRTPGPLRQGDRLIVQVSKDSTKNKWPVLTSDIELVGKNLIYFPSKEGISFSKRFKDIDRKKQIKNRLAGQVKDGFGYIVRTNAEGATLKSISSEAEKLSATWEEICNSAAKKRGTPCIYQAPSVYIADIRDIYGKDIREIITDSRQVFEKIRKYLEEFQPEDLARLVLYDGKDISLDLVYGVTRQVGEALNSRVWLKSGGYLVIEHTEALTVIDVNTGKSTDGRNAQKKYLQTNLEAAKETARQLRVRNLSGIIVIDFINMKSAEDRNTLMEALRTELAEDPLRPELVDMTGLGLIEITRKKARRPLYELLDI